MGEMVLFRLERVSRSTWPLIGITLASFLVRVWGIHFGLPYIYNTDEAWFPSYALAFGATRDFSLQPLTYPPLLTYFLLVFYAGYFVIGTLVGVFHSVDDFAISFFRDPTPFYLIGRGFVALLAVATVPLVYALGSRVYGRRVGLVAALFVAFAPEHVINSHYIKTQVPLTFFAVLSVLIAYHLWHRGKMVDYIGASFLTGLSAGMLQPGLFLSLPLALAYAFPVAGRPASWRQKLLKLPVAAGVFSWLVGLFVGNPPLFLDFGAYVTTVRAMSGIYATAELSQVGPFGHLLLLNDTLGFPLAALSVAGVVQTLIRRRPDGIFLLSFPVIYVAFFSAYPFKAGYHVLPAHPFLALLAAALLINITDKANLKGNLGAILLAALAIVVVLLPAVRVVKWDNWISQADTRTLAKEWIEENLPAGSKVLLDSGKYYTSAASAPLADSKENLQSYYEASLREDPLAPREFVGGRRKSLPYASEYYRYMLAVSQSPTYDLVRISHDDASAEIQVSTLADYRRQGVQFVMVSRSAYAVYDKPGYPFPAKAAAYRAFYESLDREASLLKEFPASPERPGPTIKIYKLD